MNAKELIENNVYHNQSSVVEYLIRTGQVSEECLYGDKEIYEWWLVSPFLARKLRSHNETIIEEFGCHWWGRCTSGQAIYLDEVIREIVGDLS